MITKTQQDDLEESIDKIIDLKMSQSQNRQIVKRFTPGYDPKDRIHSGQGFDSFSEFCKTIKKNPSDVRLKALSEGTDSAGGFLCPESFKADLFAQTLEREIVRPRATIIPCPTDVINWPAMDDTSHVSNLFGGVVIYWTEEAGTKTAVDPKFRQIKFTLKKLTGFSRVSDELLEDNQVGLGAALVQQFSRAIAWYEDLAFLRGTGVGQPLGIFGSGALITVPRAVVNQVSLVDLANIMARMYPDSLNSSSIIWVFSPAVFAQLVPLVATVITWMPSSGGAAAALPKSILGLPYAVTEKVPTLGTTGDIGLYDMSYMGIADKGDIRVDTSQHLYFQTDETAFRFVRRVDGHALVDSAFSPYNGGATLSPFVQLSSSTS